MILPNKEIELKSGLRLKSKNECRKESIYFNDGGRTGGEVI